MSNLIKPCADCHRPTRPCTAKLADHPGTMVRRGPVCDSCFRSSIPVLSPAERRARTYHLAGLTSFLARRHARELAHARADHYQRTDEQSMSNQGLTMCDCNHPSGCHKGTERNGSPLADSGCTICAFCDYFIPASNYPKAKR